MKQENVYWAIAAISPIVFAFSITAASAKRAPGAIGQGERQSARNCAGYYFSMLRNDCADRHTYTIPLTLDNPGSDTSFKFRAQGAAASENVGCQAISRHPDGQAVWTSPQVWMSEFGPIQEVDLGSLPTSPKGYAALTCWLDGYGILHSVEWAD